MKTILDILNFHKEELNVTRKADWSPGKENYAVEYFGELKKPGVWVYWEISYQGVSSKRKCLPEVIIQISLAIQTLSRS